MLLRRSTSRFLLIAAVLAGLSACGSDNDISVRPLTLGDTVALTSGNKLISFNRNQPNLRRTSATVTGIGAGETVVGVDFRPANGMLYGLTVDGSDVGRLYTIDVSTGAATLASTLSADAADASAPYATLSGNNFGVDFNPVPDRLRVVSDSGQNLRINVTTGATITDGALTLDNDPATGVTAAAYTDSFGATCRTTLFYLDTTANTLLSTSAPNNGVLTTVGALGVTASSDVSAFEISTSSAGTNSAFAAVTGASGSALYSVNTTTGAATLVAPISTVSGETVLGLAIAPPATAPSQAQGELFGLTEGNRLVSFNLGFPGKLCSDAAISGLSMDEDLLGIDFRPATGELIGLTDGGALGSVVVIDPATAAITGSKVPLINDGSNSVAYGGLSGTDFGVDFNPVPDRLRVTSDTGQNLRINVSTGATIVDGAHNGANSSGGAGAAYTNSVAGAATTTLYIANTEADILQIQNPPNAGTLVNVGALGVNLAVVNGFDIDGRDNVALLAGATDGVTPATTSTLYTVNLSTGAITSLGAIGSTNGLATRLRGLTRPTPTVTVFGLRGGTELVTLSPSAPSTVTSVGTISGLGGETLTGLDFRPLDGLLYAVGSGGGLFTVNPTTAAATRVALAADPADMTSPFAGLSGTAYGVDFNPVPNALRVVSDTEQNLRVTNVGNGNTFTDGILARNVADSSFAIDAAGYINSVPGTVASTTLYGLDPASDRLVAVNPPNNGVVRVVGPTGVPVAENSAMEIIGPTASAVAVAVLDPVARSLYTVNLTTGAATLVGNIGGTGSILGLAAAPEAAAPAVNSTLYAVTDAGSLLSFARNAPAAVTTTALSGIGAGETVAGIDFRPATSVLYLLSRDGGGVGRLYTVNVGTGAATLVGTLNDGASPTPVNVLLTGTQFGVDFNPVPDRLRIISNTRQNLRVNVGDNGSGVFGVTIVDGAVNQPTPDVHAAAYTNSFFPQNMAGTLLYVIDAATGSLLTQNPANDGTLFNVATHSATGGFTTTSGFDIAGGANGLVLAALQTTGESASRLYRVNLTTGALTESGTGGLMGASPINGLAIRIQ